MTNPAYTALQRIVMVVLATVAWFALVLQLYLMIANAHAIGTGVPRAILNYFSFFTILNNLLVALAVSFSLWTPHSGLSHFFSRPAVTSGVAVYIAIVGAGYSLLLRHLWNPQGAQKMADILLHDVVPLLYLGYWIMLAPKRRVPWRSLGVWLLYPLAYVFYSLIRGALTSWYPYPFLDAVQLGYPRVLTNVITLLLAFLMISCLVFAITRWLAEDPRQSEIQVGPDRFI